MMTELQFNKIIPALLSLALFQLCCSLQGDCCSYASLTKVSPTKAEQGLAVLELMMSRLWDTTHYGERRLVICCQRPLSPSRA